MRTTIVALVIVVLSAILILTGVVGSSPTPTSSAVQIPLALQFAAGAFLLGLLTTGTNYLFVAIGLDLREYAAPVSVTVAAFLTSLAQGWIDLAAVQYDPAIQLIINILVVVIGGVGTLRLWPKRQRTDDNRLL